MHDWVTGLVLVLGGVTCVALLVLLALDRVAGDSVFAFLGVVELVLLAQVVLGFVALAGTDRDVSGVLFGSYLVGIVLVLPIGAFWSLAERNRAGTGVLLVAALAVVGMQLRLVSIWSGAGV